MFWFKIKEPYISQILLKLWLIGNGTSCRPIRSEIILVIKQIWLPPYGTKEGSIVSCKALAKCRTFRETNQT